MLRPRRTKSVTAGSFPPCCSRSCTASDTSRQSVKSRSSARGVWFLKAAAKPSSSLAPGGARMSMGIGSAGRGSALRVGPVVEAWV